MKKHRKALLIAGLVLVYCVLLSLYFYAGYQKQIINESLDSITRCHGVCPLIYIGGHEAEYASYSFWTETQEFSLEALVVIGILNIAGIIGFSRLIKSSFKATYVVLLPLVALTWTATFIAKGFSDEYPDLLYFIPSFLLYLFVFLLLMRVLFDLFYAVRDFLFRKR